MLVFKSITTGPDASRTRQCSLEIGLGQRLGAYPVTVDGLAYEFCHGQISSFGLAVEPVLVFRVYAYDGTGHKKSRDIILVSK